MSFALLALICVVALLGPALALPRWLHLPVVIGELIVGILLGGTGLRLLSAADQTLSFLAEVGFVLVMFVAGSHVPLRDASLIRGLRTGAARAGLVAVAAIGMGVLLGRAFGTGHELLYAVLLASSSAGVILPALGGAPLGKAPLAEMVPQIALADAACIVLLPLAIDPPRAGRAAVGALAVIAAGGLAWLTLRWLERTGRRRRVHELSEDRGLAIELRFLLALNFSLAAVAVAFSVSVMLAGFVMGLAVSAVGEPRRVAKQVFALTEGLFSPIFFVWLGASLDLRSLGAQPSAIVLGLALGVAALAVHAAPVILRQPPAVAMLTAAQLGVPVAAATLGSQQGKLGPGESAALLLGALITIAATGVLAPRVAAAATSARETPGAPSAPSQPGPPS